MVYQLAQDSPWVQAWICKNNQLTINKDLLRRVSQVKLPKSIANKSVR